MTVTLYPIKTEPVLTDTQRPETVTESRWHQPLSLPVRTRKLNTAVSITSGGIYAIVDVGEVINLDKWYSPLTDPMLRRGIKIQEQPSFYFVEADPFPETVTIDRWQQPISQPTYRKKPVSEQPYLAIGYSDLSRDVWWHVPLSQPTYRRMLPIQEQPVFQLGLVDLDTRNVWFQPLSQPTYRKKPVSEYPYLSIGYSDKGRDIWWFNPLSQPTYRKGMDVRKQQFLFLTRTAPVVINISPPINTGTIYSPVVTLPVPETHQFKFERRNVNSHGLPIFKTLSNLF